MRWYSWLLMMMCLVLLPSVSEAKSKCKRCRTSCSVRVTHHRTVIRTKVETTCTGDSCVNTGTEQTGWQFAAEAEARSGAPAQHFYSASQLASMAGHPGASVFVGVGCNGTTCQGYGSLVAEARNGNKTVRIWLR